MAESDFQGEPPRERPRRPPTAGDDQVQRWPAPNRPRIRTPRAEDAYAEPDAVETFIPYKNPKGLIAYYLGVFSLIPCAGLVLGPAALILGIMGVRYSQRFPEARGAGHAITGIVLGALTTLGNWGVAIFFLVGIAVSK
jgi:hypothetical protein